MTDTSQTRLSYVAETTYGVTPATPAFKNARFTSESFNPSVQYVSSNEIRPDRNVSDMTRVGQDAAGDVGFELSYGSFDDFLASLFFNDWTSNVLKNGVVQKSFTIEKTFETGATDQFHRYRGAVVNTMSLNMQAKEIVTGSFGFMAKDSASAQAAISGATYAAPNSNPVINAANNFAGFGITGMAGIDVMGLSLSITNNLRQQSRIGDISSKGIGAGQFNVTGELNAYFQDQSLYEAYINDQYKDLAFSLGGASNLKYAFLLPRLKFTGAEVVAGGNNADVMVRMPFQAIYDQTTGATMQITRTP